MTIPEDHWIVLIKLIVAHLLGDFLMQSKKWVNDRNERKIKSKYLYLHVAIHGLLVYLLVARWSLWQLPLAITIVHFIIDLFKIYRLKSLGGFVLDQFIHICFIFLVWGTVLNHWQELKEILIRTDLSIRHWAILTGYIIVIWPGAVFIGQATSKWNIQEITLQNGNVNTGKWIGIIERLLILTFILAGYLQAIGFLIAAKSVFRIGEARGDSDRKKTEYILVGTLLSFGIATLVGIIITKFL